MAQGLDRVVVWPTDHSPFLTRPGEVADLLELTSPLSTLAFAASLCRGSIGCELDIALRIGTCGASGQHHSGGGCRLRAELQGYNLILDMRHPEGRGLGGFHTV